MKLDVYLHFEDRETNNKLEKIIATLKEMQQKEVIEVGAIEDLKVATDDLVVKVTNIKTVTEAAAAAISGIAAQNAALAQQLADAIAANNPALIAEASVAITAQSSVLNDSALALAAAIPANT